jgi:CSLREA domain-containing protein
MEASIMGGTLPSRPPIILAAMFAFSLFALSAHAAPVEFHVNTTADTHDAKPGNGVCADSNSKCSLRAAIEESDGPNAPVIYVPPGTYNLTQGVLTISRTLAIRGIKGQARSTIIDAQENSSVLRILGSKFPAVSLYEVTIQHGQGDRFSSGGGISIDSGATLRMWSGIVRENKATQFGGGIDINGGKVYLIDVAVEENCVSNASVKGIPCASTPLGSGGGVTEGGGGIMVRSGGSLSVSLSSITGNRATRGGGIQNGGGSVEITSSTISSNQANTRGGGILNYGPMKIAFSTVANNEANAILGNTFDPNDPPFGGGMYLEINDIASDPSNPGATLTATILAANRDNRDPLDSEASPDCYTGGKSILFSDGGNIVGIMNTNCSFGGQFKSTSDRIGNGSSPLDPKIHLLGFNGGLTSAHTLYPTSLAIDAVPHRSTFYPVACPDTDQFGQHRPSGLLCDAGSVEYQQVFHPLAKGQ